MPANFCLVKGMKKHPQRVMRHYPQRVRISKTTETLLMTKKLNIFMAPENLPRVFRNFFKFF